MKLSVKSIEPKKKPDFVSMACISASVSFKKQLAPDELIHALLSGKVPSNKEAHFITLFEEASPSLLAGLIEQVSAWAKSGKVEKNMQKIAKQVGLSKEGMVWQKSA